MAAAAPLHRDETSQPRPSLHLVPAARTTPPRFAEVAWATTLSLVLGLGIIGVLLLNTATQTQADRIAAQKARLAALALTVEQARTAADQAAAPTALAARARALDLRPAKQIGVLQLRQSHQRAVAAKHTATTKKVSARAPAARRVRAG